MNSSENLFAPPRATIGIASTSNQSGFFGLFIRWEKYRLIYNGILLIETLSISLLLTDIRRLIFSLIGYAIIANVCFCGGLVLNGYAWLLGQRSEWVGRILFVLGTLLAMILVIPTLIWLVRPAAFLAD